MATAETELEGFARVCAIAAQTSDAGGALPRCIAWRFIMVQYDLVECMTNTDMPEGRREQITVPVDAVTKARLLEAAARERRTVANFVRCLIARELEPPRHHSIHVDRE